MMLFDPDSIYQKVPLSDSLPVDISPNTSMIYDFVCQKKADGSLAYPKLHAKFSLPWNNEDHLEGPSPFKGGSTAPQEGRKSKTR